jgi:hypothetical protein
MDMMCDALYVLRLGCLGRVLFEVKSLRLSGILDSALHNGATNSVQGIFQCISWCVRFAVRLMICLFIG